MLTDDEWDDLIVFELGEDERSESLRSVVERIVTARVRAARAQELRDTADSVGDDWFEHRLQLNLMGIRSWLSDRANHIESSQTE